MCSHSPKAAYLSVSVHKPGDSLMHRLSLPVSASVIALAAALLPLPASAQQSQIDLHGSMAVGTSSHNKSRGGGAGAQFTVDDKPVKVSLSPGIDYLKQENSGPSQTSLSLDMNVQPGGNSPVTPYVGASASANWSGGDNKQWEGSRLGLEAMAGAQFKLGSSSLSAKAEERFGYVKGQEHTLTTRLGVLISL